MEYLSCLFQFNKYSIDSIRKAVVFLNEPDRTRAMTISESGRYLILWERRSTPSEVDTSDNVWFTELIVEVIAVVYDLERGTYYRIPQGRMVHLTDKMPVNIQISSNEKTAMILVRESTSGNVTWWNLETRQIIRTIDMNDSWSGSLWTITNDHLVYVTCYKTVFYSSIGETFRDTSLDLYEGVNDEDSGFFSSRNGEIVRIVQQYGASQGFVYATSFYNVYGRTSRTLKIEVSEHSSVESAAINSQITRYLPLLGNLKIGIRILDMSKTGEPLLACAYHQDIQDWRKGSGHAPISKLLRLIVFQKQTLIKILGSFLSVTSVPVYQDLPETLKYMIVDVLSI